MSSAHSLTVSVGFLAVAFLCLFLPFPALTFPLYDWNKGDVYVWRFLVPMKVRSHNILLTEHEAK
mgnify:CR=1 FL=1